MQDFEKLGLFYLGRRYDLDEGKPLQTPVLYDSRDLLTHALCVGMTGSGKTGLCLGLIEEAAIDNVPVVAIDPKGDLGNLLLTFPRLAPEDFRPWIDEAEAGRAGLAPDAFAEQQSRMWRQGLEDWGQDGARIGRLRGAADFAIYTPGSTAGLPVSVLPSFAAPAPPVRMDAELLGERAGGTATSLAALAGVEAPPRSREHTLLTTVLSDAWREGRDLDLTAIIHEVQTPAFTRVGVVDLDTFFPQRERFDLAMRLNAVLAAPGFASWFEGEPLDPSRLLYTADGRPRVIIFSIAHLAEQERMFFVSLLLHAMVGWMRTQTGTSSLRTVLFMDEIAGYFPPVASPPSKPPLLTLLKQGRAYGLGVVLATQNPVDLDYKGLANIGTWFLGRLQTERDKARVLDGLQGTTAGALDRAAADRILSTLGKRVFLLQNVHDNEPVVFQTRWTLSYLRGPLTRDQIRALGARPGPPGATPAAPAAREASAHEKEAAQGDAPPVVPPGIQQFFLPLSGGGGSRGAVYSPIALGAARVTFADTKLGVDVTRDVIYQAEIGSGAVAVDWAGAAALDLPVADLRRAPDPGASYEPLPPAAMLPKHYGVWEKTFTRWLVQNEKIELFRHRESRLTSKPHETDRDFRIRVQDSARAARDEALDDVRRKYAAKHATLAERLRRAEAGVERESEQASQQKIQTALSFGATIMGALLGRRAVSAGTVGRATTAARGVGRSMKETSDVKRASETAEAVRAQIRDLDEQAREEAQTLAAAFDRSVELERVTLLPKRGQVLVHFVALGWDPR